MSAKTEEWARQARDFVTMQRQAALSTHSRSPKGYPFGSLVNYDITPAGEIVTYVARIAEHFKNLAASPQASLLIFDPFSLRNFQLSARATILVEFQLVPEAEMQAVQKSFEARFPGVIRPEIAPSFAFLRAAPLRVRWVGGFGDIGWIDGELFAKSIPDVVAYRAHEIITRINVNAPELLVQLVRAHSSFGSQGYALSMVHVDAYGCTIALDNDANRELLKIPFSKVLSSFDEVEGALGEIRK